MALVGLKYLESDNSYRRKVCEKYEKELTKAGIQTVKTHPDCSVSSRHLFQIIVKERDRFMMLLNSKGIYPGVHYRDNTVYKVYKKDYGVCPNSLKLSEKLISLPLHLNLTDEDVDYVIKQVIIINNII